MKCKCPKCGMEFERVEPASEQSQGDRDMETIGAGIELSLKLRDWRLFDALDRALLKVFEEIEEELKARN